MNESSRSNAARRPAASEAETEAVPSWLDRVSEVVFHCDAEGMLTFVNAAWSRLTGFDGSVTLGRDLGEFAEPGDRDVHDTRFRDVLEGRRRTLQHELRVRTSDGDPRWFELRAQAEMRDGRVVGVAGTLADISIRREMEDELRSLAYDAEEARADAESAAQLLRVEVEELSRERDQAAASARASAEFLASMAHDLRTPLNGVLGMTEILLHGSLDDAQRDQALTVRSSAESLVRLVGDIVDFSRAGAGQIEVTEADFDVREVIDDVNRLLAQKALAKGIGFTANVSPSVPERLRGDAAHLRQVLTNLASNAVRFTDAGGVTVIASRAPGERPDGRVTLRLEVHDTDTRLTTEQLSGLFNGAGGAAGDASVHGSGGLGLAISRRLVELMNGTLEVGSEAGQGSWIRVELPLAPAAVTGAPRVIEAPEQGPLPLHVLVAEDNLVNQKVAARLLARWGVITDVVGDGEAAVKAVQIGAYDVVLMDVRMPLLDGLEATAAIRALDARRGGHTPIVAMTANVLSGDRERCLEAGMDGFVGKPIQAAELHAELARWAPPARAAEREAA